MPSLYAAPSPSTLWTQKAFAAQDFLCEPFLGWLGCSSEGWKDDRFVHRLPHLTSLRGYTDLLITKQGSLRRILINLLSPFVVLIKYSVSGLRESEDLAGSSPCASPKGGSGGVCFAALKGVKMRCVMTKLTSAAMNSIEEVESC